MIKSEVDLPQWATELLLECEVANSFTPLVAALRGRSIHPAYKLSDGQRSYLYKRAGRALVRKAQILWWWARSGRTEAAAELHKLIRNAKVAEIDLTSVLQSSPKSESEMLEYMSRVEKLRRAYIRRLGYDLEALADNLLSSDPIETWEYGVDQAEVLELARRYKLDVMRGYIGRCREGDTFGAKDVLQAVQILGYNWSDLDTSEAEIKTWVRHEVIRGIVQKLSPGIARLSEEMLYANIHGPLKRMLQYGIRLEEIGSTVAELKQARQRLERWIDSTIAELYGPENRDERHRYRDYKATVFPLFQQVLNQG